MRTVNNPYPKIPDYDQFLKRVKANWECVTQETIAWYPEGIIDDYTIVTACANMSAPKRRRILEADKNAQQKGDFYSQGKSISIKHDELLSAKTIQDTLSIKPRAIVQFSLIFIARQTTYAHTYSDLLHAMYNTSQQYRVYNKFLRIHLDVVFVFASGYTGDMLSELGRVMTQDKDRIYYCVAGDDSFTSWGRYTSLSGCPFDGGDYSMYDHTQGSAVIVEADALKLRRMGFSLDLIERNKWSAESPFQARFLSKEIILRCKINTEPQQTSGKLS